MAVTPTQRTLKHYRDQGYYCEVVERYIHQARRRKDLFGIGDVLCVRGRDVLLIQACHYSDVSKRVAKIEDSATVDLVRGAGIGIHVCGWRKVKNRYRSRVVDVS